MKDIVDQIAYLIDNAVMLNENELERFTREYATKFYVRDEDMSNCEMLDALEHISTFGDDRVPLQWILETEDDEMDHDGQPIAASHVLLVIDDHAKMLVGYVTDLFRYIHGKSSND